MIIGRKEVVVLADFMRVFVGEKMEVSAHPELPSPPPIVAPSTSWKSAVGGERGQLPQDPDA